MKTELKNIDTASAMLGVMKKPEQKTELKGIKVVKVSRPVEYPKQGKPLFSYTCAILAHLGAIAGKPFSIAAFKGMYNTPTAYTYHVSKGNIKPLENGMAQLTVSGMNKFKAGRMDGKDASQEIIREIFMDIFYLLGQGKWKEGKPAAGFSRELTEFSYSVKE